MSIPLLSICIPTYNRSGILRVNLSFINEQLTCLDDTREVEIIVSDNCSPDNTQEVVASLQKQGVPIVYNRNLENVGADRNFLKCMHLATGKYVYLLGDDDFLTDRAIPKLLSVLRGKEYGLVYINAHCVQDGSVTEYHDRKLFIKQVSYYYTFMSGCVFRRDAVDLVKDADKYMATNLLQMPFYLQSTKMFEDNVVVKTPILGQSGLDARNNGDYNFFVVFIQNYLTIMSQYIQEADLYAWLKKDIWPFVFGYTKKLLIHKDVGNFKTENGWKILFKYYGKEWYFWWTWVKFPFGVIKRKIKNLL